MAAADPELARRVAANTQIVYSEAVSEMLELVARRLARGIDQPGWAESKLADLGRLRNENRRVLNRLDESAARAISTAVTESFMAGGDAEAVQLGGEFSRNSGRALNRLIEEAVGQVTNTHEGILRSTLDDYRQIIAQSTTRVSIGTQSRQQATQKALGNFASRGISGFTDKAGRKWEIETYAEMATRTASGRAAVAGGLDRIQQRGMDLVLVSNAPAECSTCRRWEGKVLSISGDSSGDAGDGIEIAGTVSDARAAGLLHSNCRHNLSAYVPGLTRIPTHTSDPEGDALRQRQRALERNVRASKRNVAAQRAYVDQLRREPGGPTPEALASLKAAEAKQKAATARLVDHIDSNGLKRLRYRENLRGAKPDPAPPAPPKLGPRPKPKPTKPKDAAPPTPPRRRLPPQRVPPTSYDNPDGPAQEARWRAAKLAEKEAKRKAKSVAPKSPKAWQKQTRVEWGGLPKKVQDRYDPVMQSIADDYPALMDRLDYFGEYSRVMAAEGLRAKRSPGVLAVTVSSRKDFDSPKRVGIGLMKGQHSNVAKFERTVRRNKEIGHLAVGEIEGVLAHEVGHVASHMLRDQSKLPGFKFYDQVDEALRDAFHPNMSLSEFRFAKRGSIRRSVSRYAATSEEEFVAECFAAFRIDPNASDVARIVGGMMDQLLRSLS